MVLRKALLGQVLHRTFNMTDGVHTEMCTCLCFCSLQHCSYSRYSLHIMLALLFVMDMNRLC